MKKRIFKNLFIISLLTLVLSAGTSMFIYYNFYKEQSKRDLYQITKIMDVSLQERNDVQGIAYLKDVSKEKKDFRITYIAPDGNVLFDSMREADTMENHNDRPEIQEARKQGYSTSTRYSDTLSKENYYFSYAMSDGHVLRLSRQVDNIFGAFLKVLPLDLLISLLILIWGLAMSREFTKKTLEPFYDLNRDLSNFDVNEFPEISPFIHKINMQNQTIQSTLMEIRRERDTLNTILENMREGLVIIDAEKNLISVNLAAKKIFHQEHSFRGKNVLHLIRNQDMMEQLDRALSGSSCEKVYLIDGREVKTYMNPVYEDKNVRGAILLFIDETEEIRASRMREEFSSNVSHELKTPLTSICGFSELLKNNMVETEESKQEFYEFIYQDSKRLLCLIEDIIKISGLESNQQYGVEEISMQDLISDIYEHYAGLIEEKHLTARVQGNALLYENKTLLWELFTNLINNAIKYNREGGAIDVAIFEEEKTVGISVSDTGIGIPASDLNRIFERFYRVDKSRSKKSGGTGLGLSIVKHILLNLNGKIEVTSKENIGTTFRVTLPKEKREMDISHSEA